MTITSFQRNVPMTHPYKGSLALHPTPTLTVHISCIHTVALESARSTTISAITARALSSATKYDTLGSVSPHSIRGPGDVRRSLSLLPHSVVWRPQPPGHFPMIVFSRAHATTGSEADSACSFQFRMRAPSFHYHQVPHETWSTVQRRRQASGSEKHSSSVAAPMWPQRNHLKPSLRM